MKTFTLIMGAFYGLFSVMLGAYGAHALKKIISIDKLHSFEVGVRYQMYHALLLLIMGYVFKFQSGIEKSAVWFIVVGVLFFSGSIYILSMSEVWKVPTKILGPVTPLGGLFMIMGWILLLAYFIKTPVQ